MKVELKPHVGMRYDGVDVVFDQFQVFAADILVGYLSFDVQLPIMFLANQSGMITSEIVAKCAAITKRVVIPPREIYAPPEVDNSHGEDEGETDDE